MDLGRNMKNMYFRDISIHLRQAVVAIVGSLQTHFLLNTLVIYALSLPALIELHISRALLHAVDVAHELGSAGGLHLAEELHGAAGHILASSKASPGRKGLEVSQYFF